MTSELKQHRKTRKSSSTLGRYSLPNRVQSAYYFARPAIAHYSSSALQVQQVPNSPSPTAIFTQERKTSENTNHNINASFDHSSTVSDSALSPKFDIKLNIDPVARIKHSLRALNHAIGSILPAPVSGSSAAVTRYPASAAFAVYDSDADSGAPPVAQLSQYGVSFSPAATSSISPHISWSLVRDARGFKVLDKITGATVGKWRACRTMASTQNVGGNCDKLPTSPIKSTAADLYFASVESPSTSESADKWVLVVGHTVVATLVNYQLSIMDFSSLPMSTTQYLDEYWSANANKLARRHSMSSVRSSSLPSTDSRHQPPPFKSAGHTPANSRRLRLEDCIVLVAVSLLVNLNTVEAASFTPTEPETAVTRSRRRESYSVSPTRTASNDNVNTSASVSLAQWTRKKSAVVSKLLHV